MQTHLVAYCVMLLLCYCIIHMVRIVFCLFTPLASLTALQKHLATMYK